MNAEIKIPNCIGIIMDGNRRWAKNKGLSVFDGHEAGYKLVKDFLKWSKEVGIKNVVIYAFSTENWKRAPEEIADIIYLIKKTFLEETDIFMKEKMSVKFIGELSLFSEEIRNMMKNLERKTAGFSNQHVVFAVSYGGQEEIISAVNKCIKEGVIHVTKKDISEHLYDNKLPDPDVIIRTGGETRLSGFLPWQTAYSELFFTKTLWPDFSKEEFLNILSEYSVRERRMGK